MRSIESLREYLLKYHKDEYGDVRIDGLDFSDFEGNVFIGKMKVGKSLYQHSQNVGFYLFQDNQTVGHSLYQKRQKVGIILSQSEQQVGYMLFQQGQNVGGEIIQDKIKKGKK